MRSNEWHGDPDPARFEAYYRPQNICPVRITRRIRRDTFSSLS